MAAPNKSDTPTASKDKAAAPSRPERPNEEEYKAELAKAEKELKSAEERLKAVKGKLDNARPNNKDSPAGKRQAELRNELSTIRQQQQSSKSGRTQVMDKIKRLDENLKSRIQEQKNARGKIQYKSADDVQREIDRLQKQVDTGSMKIVDEKKALADISQLNRQKKSFAGFDEAQRGIDDVKAQIAELKKSMDDPEARALSERYTQITAELDAIKAEQDEAFKGLNALRDERTRAHEQQQKAYGGVKEVKDRYFAARRAAQEYEREARRIRDEKRRAENDAYHRGKRQEVARQKLEEASAPAYQDEIRTAQNLIAYFDPGSAQKATAAGPSKFAATASRTVDDAGMKGTKLSKKTEEEDSYFVGSGGKKNKRKGQRGGEGAVAASTPTGEGAKFNLDLGTIDSLGRIGVDPPMSQADVPNVVETLKGKLEHWKGDQKRKTDENIAKAQAEIDRLEADAAAAGNGAGEGGATDKARKPAVANQGVNGHADAGAQAAQEEAADGDVAAEMQKVKVEDEEGA